MIRAARIAGMFALAAIMATPTAAPAQQPEPMARRDARLVAAALDALPAQRPGTIDLYAVGFAGDGTEDVFRNEVGYFSTLAKDRLKARGVAALVNHIDSIERAPAALATYENLRDLLDGIARRMDVEEDVLLLYLTMHGTPDHELALMFPPFVEDALIPEDLRTVLDEAGIRNRVLVISACYSGGFIRQLRGPDTLVITAARADRPSFGCGAGSSVTWFGRAWMVEGLNRSASFAEAYEYATQRVRGWEKAEKIEASFPQISEGRRIRERLAQWRSQTPSGEPVAYPYPIEDLEAVAQPRKH